MRLQRDRHRIKVEYFPTCQSKAMADSKGPKQWHNAVDPVSGRTYYFDVESRKSQWEKPLDLVTERELVAKRRKRAEDLLCFREMEKNIYYAMESAGARKLGCAKAIASLSRSKDSSSPSCLNVNESRKYERSSQQLRDDDGVRACGLGAFLFPCDPLGCYPLPGCSQVPSHVRHKTSGSVHIGDSLFEPDVDKMTQSICTRYRSLILGSSLHANCPSGTTSPASVHEVNASLYVLFAANIFDDRISHTKTSALCRASGGLYHVCGKVPPPSLEQIVDVYCHVFNNGQCEHDVLIISLLYVERLMRATRGVIRPSACNWKSVLLSCLMLASKVWDDCSMWNVDFSNVCQKGPRCLLSFSLKRLNELEVALLKCINFNVRVSVSDYTACYFHLQSVKLSKQDGVDKTVPVADSSSKISPHEVRQRSNSRRSDAASSERYTS